MHSKKIRSFGRSQTRKPKSQINCRKKEQMRICFRRCWFESPPEAFSGSLKTALKRLRYNDRISYWSLPPLKLIKSSGLTQLKLGAAVVAELLRPKVQIPPGAGLFFFFFFRFLLYLFLLSFTSGVSFIRSLKRRCISNCVL